MTFFKQGLNRLTATWLLLVTATFASAQKQHPLPTDNPGIVRWEDPNASCKFAPEYRRIRANKTDPRVAFIELESLIQPEQPVDFGYSCKNIAVQSEDVKAAVFDKARGFLHVVYGEPIFNVAVAYFAPKPGGEGVMLYVDNTGHLKMRVFTYRDNKWQDVSQKYLEPLHLAKDDFIVVPQYGRTARLMSYDPGTGEISHPKSWITWDGTKFVPTQTRPPDWKCPDSYRYFYASERAQVCR